MPVELRSGISAEIVNKLIDDRYDERENALVTRIQQLERKVASLEHEQAFASVCRKNLERKIDDCEQYSRKVSLVLHGVPVKRGDDDSAIRQLVVEEIKRLKLDILEREVDRAHRTGAPYFNRVTKSRVTPVIVRLTSWYARNEFYNARKDSKFFIKADMTQRRLDVLNQARDLQAVENSTAAKVAKRIFADRNCHLTFISIDDRFFKFNSIDEFANLINYVEDTTPPLDAVWKGLESDKERFANESRRVANESGVLVNLRGMDIAKWLTNPGHTYIGPARDTVPASKWENPFKLGDDGDDPATLLSKFEEHVTTSPELSAALGELRGKVLGCFCAPGACHGDILNKLVGN